MQFRTSCRNDWFKETEELYYPLKLQQLHDQQRFVILTSNLPFSGESGDSRSCILWQWFAATESSILQPTGRKGKYQMEPYMDLGSLAHAFWLAEFLIQSTDILSRCENNSPKNNVKQTNSSYQYILFNHSLLLSTQSST